MKQFLLKKTTIKIAVVCIAFLLIGVIIGRITKEPEIIKNKVLRQGGYTYINPILLCNIDNQQSYNENTSLTKKISDYVKKSPENNISVYYLALTGGTWAGLNENVQFSPASMLKVPTVVDTLKYVELNPGALSRQIYYDGSFDDNRAEYFKPQKWIEAGKSYSLDDLITYTIAYSDNNALRLIHDNVSPSALASLYKDLSINIPENTIDFMSTKTYTLFLRVLYNSTYLNREMSEKILKLMTTPDFPQGLQAGIPDSVEVAQKFGERQVFDTSGKLIKRELHDCGIVYKDNKPYIICVMTSGMDFTSLSNNIKDISQIVYDNI